MQTSTGTAALLLLTFLVPSFARAQVVISEFLYDAQGADTDQEYVELFNAGSDPVDLTKWKINDGSSHSLNVPPKNGGTGSISIPAGGYVLLVNDAAAFLGIHTGLNASVIDTVLSLPNAGGTLTLLDESGALSDTAVYTKDSGAAGDGYALHRGSVGGTIFIPGASSLGSGTLSVQNSQTIVTTTSQTATTTATETSTPPPPAQVSSYVPPPVPILFADAGLDRTVIVAADIEFRARAYNKNKEIVDNVRFHWNFGDGSNAEGQNVLHHFNYPGRYAVVLTIAENRDAASDRMIVTAEPARLSFDAMSDGSVAIGNKANRDLDVSGWVIRSLPREFILPSESIILSGETLRISEKTLGFWSGAQTELGYPNGSLALRAGGATQEQQSAPPIVEPIVEPIVTAVAELPAPQPRKRASEPTLPEQLQDTEEIADVPNKQLPSEQLAAASGAAESGNSYAWWLGALGLATLGAGAAYAIRRTGNRDWNIIEEGEI